MSHVTNSLKSFWESCLSEYPHLSREQQNSLMGWLMGGDTKYLGQFTVLDDSPTANLLHSRYEILKRYYLRVTPVQAYRRLFNHLGSVLVSYPQIRAWIKSSRQNQNILVTTLQTMIEEMLHHDAYIKRQQAEIAKLTEDLSLRNALLLAAIEEYCLCPLDNDPLIVHLLSRFLQREQAKESEK